MAGGRFFGAAAALCLWAGAASAEEAREIKLVQADGVEIAVGEIVFAPQPDGTGWRIDWNEDRFGDYFLSMRPFRCMEGPEKLWCRVGYPYENLRDISGGDLTDLEYDLLFVWKDKADYGIDLWNGVYYRLSRDGDAIGGAMHDIDLGVLAAPPEPGDLRPVQDKHLEEADPDGHWLPYLVIE